MKITNKLGLPEALVDGIALMRQDYKRGDCDYTATQLSKPPMIVRLERDHAHEIEVDAIDMLWSMFGSAFHLLASRGASAKREEIAELRLFATYTKGRKKWIVSGQADLYSGMSKTIYDYKTTSPWTVVFNPKGQPEWEQQLNVLADIFRKNNYGVKGIADVLLFRGWSSSEAKRTPTYPREKAVVLSQDIWPEGQVYSYVVHRCSIFDSALNCSPEEIGSKKCPPCSSEEQWCRSEGWAVQKIGRQRARRIFKPDKLGDAQKLAEDLGNMFMVLPRFGRRVRCEEACTVNKWCKDWNNYKERLALAEKETDEDGPPNPTNWD